MKRKIFKAMFVAGMVVNFSTAMAMEQLPQNWVLIGFAIGEVLIAPTVVIFIASEIRGER